MNQIATPQPPRRSRLWRMQRNSAPYLFVLPFLILFAVFILYPLVNSIASLAAVVLCGLSVAQAADAPWHHTSVARLDQSHPGPALSGVCPGPGPRSPENVRPPRYLRTDIEYGWTSERI